jgi:hypothetical protein
MFPNVVRFIYHFSKFLSVARPPISPHLFRRDFTSSSPQIDDSLQIGFFRTQFGVAVAKLWRGELPSCDTFTFYQEPHKLTSCQPERSKVASFTAEQIIAVLSIHI